MLRRLTIENCYSFLNPTTLSFLVSQKAPQSDRYRASAVEGERLSKVIGILGANASGKSNLLRVVDFLKWFIVDSFRAKTDSALPVYPFLLQEKPYRPSRIEVEFECGLSIFRYVVLLEDSAIQLEELDVLELERIRERGRFKNLFTRSWSSEADSYKIKSHPDFKLSDGIVEIASKRRNASLISAAVLSNHEQSLPLKQFWGQVTTKLKQGGEANPSFWQISEFYHKNEKFKTSMEKVMAMCDLGLVGLDIERIELPQLFPTQSTKSEFYTPWGRHPGLNGKEYRLPFAMESAGTQQIYILLSHLLPVLSSGGLAVIDELETDLHPDLLPTLMELFSCVETNPHGAQLIFTTHATPILDRLDKYQVGLVDKSSSGTSHLSRLDQLEGVRSDDNLFAKYVSGAYGGIPHVSHWNTRKEAATVSVLGEIDPKRK